MISAGVIEAILRLRDEFTAKLELANNKLQQTGQRAQQIGASMRAAGTNLTAGLTLPIVALGGAAIAAFSSFEAGMNKVRALSGLEATSKSFQALKDLALELGATTKFSASEAAGALGFLAMAGFTAAEQMKTLPGVLELAASASLDLSVAADITTNILTGYGRTVDQIGETNDVLVKAFTSANTNLQQLGQAFKFVGPVAKAAGIEFEESAAVLSLMGNAGIQATMAGTALRGAISRLLNPTKQVQEAIAELGLVTKDSSGQLLPMADIIQQLGEKGADAAQIMKLFGLRAGPAMAGLVSQGSDAIRKLTAELRDSDGVAQKISRTMLEGVAGSMIRLKSAAEGAFIAMGEQLAPAFTKILEKGIAFSNWVRTVLVPAFAALPVPIQQIVIGLLAIAAAIGPVLIVAGSLVAAWGALGITMGGLSIAGASVLAFLTGPVGITLALVALLLSIKPVRDALVALATILKNTVVEAFRIVSVWVEIAWNWFKKFLGTVEDGPELMAFLGRGFDILKGAIDAVVGGLQKVAEETSLFGKTAGEIAEIQLAKMQKRVEELTEALGPALLEGTIAELNKAMFDLGTAGGLTDEALRAIAERAIMLRDEGEELTVGLTNIVTWFEREAAEAARAAAELAANEKATTDAAAASLEYVEALKALKAELGGAGVFGALKLWQGALGENFDLTGLTRDEIDRLNGVLEEAIEKYKALGIEVPAAVQAAFNATEMLTSLADALKESAKQAKIASDKWFEDFWKKMGDDADAMADRVISNFKVLSDMNKEITLLNDRRTLDSVTFQLVQVRRWADEQQKALNKNVGNYQASFDAIELVASLTMDEITAEHRAKLLEMAADTVTVGDQIKDVFFNMGADLNNVLVAAIEGGDIGAALQSLATNLTSGLLNAIPVVGPFISQFAPAIVSGLIAIFGGRSVARNISLTIERSWGAAISEGLAEAMEAQVKSGEFRDAQAAIFGNTASIIAEQGGVVAFGIQKSIAKTRDLFVGLETGRLTSEQFRANFEPLFAEILPNAIDKTTGKMTDDFRELITLAQRFGEESAIPFQELTDTIAETEGGMQELLQLMVDGILTADQVSASFDAAFGNALPAAIDSFTGVADASFVALITRVKELGIVSEEVSLFMRDQAMAGADALTRFVDSSALGSKASFEAAQFAAVAFFNTAVENGANFTEVLAQMGPTFATLIEKMEEAGITAAPAFQTIANAARLAADEISGPLISGAAAAGEMLVALANTGQLNQATFQQLGQTIKSTWNRLLAGGASSQELLIAMRQPIAQLIQLQDEFGLQVDAGTQAIIDQGREAGITGDDAKSASELQIEATNRLITALDLLIQTMGGVGLEAEQAAGQAGTAFGNAADAAGGIGDELDGINFSGFVSDAREAAGEAQEAMDAVSFGGSPGGIKEIPIQLKIAQKAMQEFQRAAVDAMTKTRVRVDQQTGVSPGPGSLFGDAAATTTGGGTSGGGGGGSQAEAIEAAVAAAAPARGGGGGDTIFKVVIEGAVDPEGMAKITQEQVIPAFKRFVNENRDQLRTELRDALGITGGG